MLLRWLHPFESEKTNTSDTKDDTHNMIVLGPNWKVGCICQLWSSKNPIELQVYLSSPYFHKIYDLKSDTFDI